jgi:hypothetical protein
MAWTVFHFSNMTAAPAPGSWARLGLTLAWRGVKNPRTGLALLRTGWRFRARAWYREFPFLPLPERGYLRWRMYTAYGDEGILPPAEDIVRYARWAVRKP